MITSCPWSRKSVVRVVPTSPEPKVPNSCREFRLASRSSTLSAVRVNEPAHSSPVGFRVLAERPPFRGRDLQNGELPLHAGLHRHGALGTGVRFETQEHPLHQRRRPGLRHIRTLPNDLRVEKPYH